MRAYHPSPLGRLCISTVLASVTIMATPVTTVAATGSSAQWHPTESGGMSISWDELNSGGSSSSSGQQASQGTGISVDWEPETGTSGGDDGIIVLDGEAEGQSQSQQPEGLTIDGQTVVGAEDATEQQGQQEQKSQPVATQTTEKAAEKKAAEEKKTAYSAGSEVPVAAATYALTVDKVRLATKSNEARTVSVRGTLSNTTSTAMEWEVVPTSGGFFMLAIRGSNGALVLDSDKGDVHNGAWLCVREKTGANSQQWRAFAKKDSEDALKSGVEIRCRANQSLAIGTTNGSKGNGAYLALRQAGSSAALTVTVTRKRDVANPTKGVWIKRPSGKSTTSVWYGKDGKLAKNRVITTSEGAGAFWWATGNGTLAKSKAIKSGNLIYLANSNGKLAGLSNGASRGWVTSSAFGTKNGRYYLYKQKSGVYAAKYGYSTAGYPHFTMGNGNVRRGTWKDSKTGHMYFASSQGKMLSLPSNKSQGWVSANFIPKHGSQRYYLFKETANGVTKGMAYAVGGYSQSGGFHYTTGEGYVLRNKTITTWAGSTTANKNGIITTNFNTQDRVLEIVWRAAQRRDPSKEKRNGSDYTAEIGISNLNIKEPTIWNACWNKEKTKWQYCDPYGESIWRFSAYKKGKNGLEAIPNGAKADVISVIYEGSASYVKNLANKVNKIIDAPVKAAKRKGSRWDKATYLHDWLAKRMSYDYSLTPRDGAQGLIDRKGTCDAFARAYCYLCFKAGLDCRYVTGMAQGAYYGYHAWNKVWVTGGWRYTDVCWDAGGWGRKYNLRTDAWMRNNGHWAYDA